MYFSRTTSVISTYINSSTKNVEYKELIESVLNNEVLKRLDEGTFHYDLIPVKTDFERLIVEELISKMKGQLNYVHSNNDTGYFGVITQNRHSFNWSYLNLVENRYSYAPVFYAETLEELERKVKAKGNLWYVFDEDLAFKSQKRDLKLDNKKSIIKPKIRSEIVRNAVTKKETKPDVDARTMIKNKRKIRMELQKKRSFNINPAYNNLDIMYR